MNWKSQLSEQWSQAPLSFRIILVITSAISATSIASIAKKIYEIKHFVLTAVNFYRDLTKPLVDWWTNSLFTISQVSLDALIILLLFYIPALIGTRNTDWVNRTTEMKLKEKDTIAVLSNWDALRISKRLLWFNFVYALFAYLIVHLFAIHFQWDVITLMIHLFLLMTLGSGFLLYIAWSDPSIALRIACPIILFAVSAGVAEGLSM